MISELDIKIDEIRKLNWRLHDKNKFDDGNGHYVRSDFSKRSELVADICQSASRGALRKLKKWFDFKRLDRFDEKRMTNVREAAIVFAQVIIANSPGGTEQDTALMRVREAVALTDMSITHPAPFEGEGDQ